MNYQRLSSLATLLNNTHGQPNQHGFIVAPCSELQLMEHKKALVHADRIFDYQPISNERLGICAVTRKETVKQDASHGVDYDHAHLENLEYDKLATAEIAPLLNEYIEYTKSRV